MLSYLHVKNLALIDEAEVEFGPGLNILTGETGAGKSILIGSINLALGKKMSREMLRNPEKPALVELIFHVEDRNCLEKFERLGYPAEDGQVVISRKLAGNRSISRMNGEICSAAQIREVASWLLDIHGQHEHQSLLYQDRQLEILDAFGKEQLGGKKAAAKECFRKWQKLERELSSCRMDEEQRRREIAFLEFELGEISQAQLTPGEDEELRNVTGRCPTVARSWRAFLRCRGVWGMRRKTEPGPRPDGQCRNCPGQPSMTGSCPSFPRCWGILTAL